MDSLATRLLKKRHGRGASQYFAGRSHFSGLGRAAAGVGERLTLFLQAKIEFASYLDDAYIYPNPRLKMVVCEIGTTRIEHQSNSCSNLDGASPFNYRSNIKL